MEVEISQEYSLDLLKKETTPTRLRNHIARNRLKLNPCNSELSLIIDYVDSEKIKEEAGRQYLDSSNLGNGSLEFIASRVPGLKDEAESRLARDANSVLHDIHNVVAT